MNDIRRFKKKSILALIIASLMVLLIWHKTGIYFETNENKYILDAVSMGYYKGSTLKYEVYDRITVSHGGTYLIYFFDGEYHIEEP